MTDAFEYRLRTVWLTGLCCAVAAALYALAEVEPSPIVNLFFILLPLVAVLLWLERDASRTGIGAVHDFGFLMWLTWPVAIPWYAWKTRRRSGWRLIVGLFAVIGSAYIGWMLAAWGSYGVRYLVWYLRTSP